MDKKEMLEEYGDLINATQETLAEAVMEAYKERCKTTVFDLLCKGPLTDRELSWVVSRISVITANTLAIFIALENNTEESNDE